MFHTIRNSRRITAERRTGGAFTLIELLIVVAIIAILAAIAIPNFLNAQVRSKVSRALSDLRTMRTAIESYAVDNTKMARMSWGPHFDDYYGITVCEAIFGTLVGGPSRLCNGTPSLNGIGGGVTTPIIYLSTLPLDPFADGRQTSVDAWLYTYQDVDTLRVVPTTPVPGMPGYVYLPPNPGALNFFEQKFGKYFLLSIGPQGLEGLRDGPGNSTADFFLQYDPTNGTTSDGRLIVSQKFFAPEFFDVAGL